MPLGKVCQWGTDGRRGHCPRERRCRHNHQRVTGQLRERVEHFGGRHAQVGLTGPREQSPRPFRRRPEPPSRNAVGESANPDQPSTRPVAPHQCAAARVEAHEVECVGQRPQSRPLRRNAVAWREGRRWGERWPPRRALAARVPVGPKHAGTRQTARMGREVEGVTRPTPIAGAAYGRGFVVTVEARPAWRVAGAGSPPKALGTATHRAGAVTSRPVAGMIDAPARDRAGEIVGRALPRAWLLTIVSISAMIHLLILRVGFPCFGGAGIRPAVVQGLVFGGRGSGRDNRPNGSGRGKATGGEAGSEPAFTSASTSAHATTGRPSMWRISP